MVREDIGSHEYRGSIFSKIRDAGKSINVLVNCAKERPEAGMIVLKKAVD